MTVLIIVSMYPFFNYFIVLRQYLPRVAHVVRRDWLLILCTNISVRSLSETG